MGKTDNIKRARRLKQEKRKREQNSSRVAGTDHGNKMLKDSITETRFITILNTGKVKYSELLKEFVLPLMETDDDFDAIKTKIIFAVFAWNAAMFKDKNEKSYKTIKNQILSQTTGNIDTEELFNGMVKRKQEEFSDYNVLIRDFELKQNSKTGNNLSVTVMPL